MDSELYTLITQKVKFNPQGKRNRPPYPLPCTVAAVLAATDACNSMLVSPGYLGTGLDTTKEFYARLDELMLKLGRGSGWPLAQIGFMRTMRSEESCKHRGYHEEVLHSGDHCLSYGPRFTFSKAWLDHRKMILFYSVQEGQEKTFDSLIRESFALGSETVGELMNIICINAIAIGSSNFSLSSYFGGTKKTFTSGEADIVLLAHKEGCPYSDFSRIIDSFDVIARTGQSRGTFLGEIDGDGQLSNNSVFSKSLYHPGQLVETNAHDYLKRIAEEVMQGIFTKIQAD